MYDKIIIGAGLYGLYAALFCARSGQRVLLLEADDAPMSRATYVNQARVHLGYHYPRSISTALKTKDYFRRFNEDFGFCIHQTFRQIYATGKHFSYTNARQFEKFCADAGIPCERLNENAWFREGLCDGAFLTTEYTYDAALLRDWFLKELSQYEKAELRCGAPVRSMEQVGDLWRVHYKGGSAETPFVLNATYASCNQLHQMAGTQPFQIKYELCEIILCRVEEPLKDIGLTVMDGPFFSIMPFGKTGLHSLTSVTFTPHVTSYDALPAFACQSRSGGSCSPQQLGNCNTCPAKPESAWPYMSSLAKKYMRPELGFTYERSLFSMKPILKASEVDDSRPTVIKQHGTAPTFVSVLSGKISTVYDLDEVLSI